MALLFGRGFAAVLCVSWAAGCSSQKPAPPILEGMYVAATTGGSYSQIDFSGSSQFTAWTTSDACVTSLYEIDDPSCIQTGTYTIDPGGTQITLHAGDAGVSTLPFNVISSGIGVAAATNEVRLLGASLGGGDGAVGLTSGPANVQLSAPMTSMITSFTLGGVTLNLDGNPPPCQTSQDCVQYLPDFPSSNSCGASWKRCQAFGCVDLPPVCPSGAAGGVDRDASAVDAGKPPPTLEDLFSGTASFGTKGSGTWQEITWTGHLLVKVSLFEHAGVYYTVSRGAVAETAGGDPVFNLFLFQSKDGIRFEQVGDKPLFDADERSWTLYDGDVVQQGSNYIMTMECAKIDETTNRLSTGASLCISQSTAPWQPGSWSAPTIIVQAGITGSASTGVMLIDDNNERYVKWSAVVPVGPNRSVSTWAQKITGDVTTNVGSSGATGQLLLGAEPFGCKDIWDCNNRDVQDWKQIGGYYYLVYNGANNPGCSPPTNGAKNQWGLAIRRSTSALGPYTETATRANDLTGVQRGSLILATDTSLCGISYPVLNMIDGVTYLYFSELTPSKLVYRVPLMPTAGTPAIELSLPDTPKLSTSSK